MTVLPTPISWPRLAAVFGMFFGLLAVLAIVFGPFDLDCALQPRACALRDLRGAKTFWGAERSDIGGLETPVRAWRKIARRSTAAGDFAELLKSSSPVTRLYAMAGLYRFDPISFERALPALIAAPDSISAYITCRPTREPIARLAAEVATGAWTREFELGLPVPERYRPRCAT